MTIIKQTINRFLDRDGFDSAAILSFSTLFAIVPGLAVGLSVFSLSPYFLELQQYLEQFLFTQLLPKNQGVVENYVQQFVAHAQELKGFTFVFLLTTVIFLLSAIDKRINLIWHDEHRRHWVQSLVSYMLVLFIGPILVGASLLVSSLVMALTFFNQLSVAPYMTILVTLGLSSLGFSILYYATPLKKVRFINAFKAGVIATLGLEIIKYALFVYIQYFSVYELIYGTLSVLMLLILWIYLAWIIVLLGASFCYCLESK